jgi:hypothetical protein
MAREVSAGCCFEVNEQGVWSLKHQDKTLASGKANLLGNRWHKVVLAFKDAEVTLALDGETMAKVNEPSCKAGLVALGTGFNEALFDNVRVAGPDSKSSSR